MTDITILCCPD